MVRQGSEMKPLIIYGNGQMARMVARYCGATEVFTVDRDCIREAEIDRKPVVAFDVLKEHYHPDDHCFLVVVGYRGMNHLRADRHLEMLQMGYDSINLINESVQLRDVEMGTGNIILEHTSIHPFTKIGDCNFISSNVNIGHGCRIRDNCWINAGVSIAGEVDLGYPTLPSLAMSTCPPQARSSR
jgi:hypothetical protein